MGTVSESEIYEVQGKGSYIRVLVEMDISNPLLPGINAGSKMDGVFWVEFQYEKLPQFCYSCGIIGHDEENCNGKIQTKEESVTLGPWLRLTQVGRKLASSTRYHKNEKSTPNAHDEERRKMMPQELLDKLSGLSVSSGGDQTAKENTGPPQPVSAPNNISTDTPLLNDNLHLTQQNNDDPSQGVTPLTDISNDSVEERTTLRRWNRSRETRSEITEKENCPHVGAVKRKANAENDHCSSTEPLDSWLGGGLGVASKLAMSHVP
ncbi:Zinc finger, CCHC-type [Sesbania bispinosa]|nr:Zinc finger, CCHC-type [Sesbania bispinosa]